ncbi:MAG: tetratricopeptide repeat protein [Myxococcales bacterium]|nr:tetratricopeptide repeat protein [Myxococcales bacterium]
MRASPSLCRALLLALVACGGEPNVTASPPPSTRASLPSSEASSEARAPTTEPSAPLATPARDDGPAVVGAPTPVNGGQPDQELNARAAAYVQAGDRMSARKTYFELIKNHPDSRLIPNAYVAFGDMFFEEAATDPSKFDLAQQAYSEALKYPPPKSDVYGYAWYKLAHVHVMKAEDAKALNAFAKVIEHAARFPAVGQGENLRRAASKDVVGVYARAGSAGAASAFFRKLTGEPSHASASPRATAMLEALGQEYFRGGKTTEAIVLYRDLAARDPKNTCRYGAFVKAAQAASRGSRMPADFFKDGERDAAQCP